MSSRTLLLPLVLASCVARPLEIPLAGSIDLARTDLFTPDLVTADRPPMDLALHDGLGDALDLAPLPDFLTCIPPGGLDDVLDVTHCCSGVAVAGSTICANPADWGTSWASCVHTCQ
jgi:hypothetical protein